jgi:hypothetical protein
MIRYVCFFCGARRDKKYMFHTEIYLKTITHCKVHTSASMRTMYLVTKNVGRYVHPCDQKAQEMKNTFDSLTPEQIEHINKYFKIIGSNEQ